MKKISLLLLASLAVIIGILAARTVAFTSRQILEPADETLTFDRDAALSRLSRAIRFQTVSAAKPSVTANVEFDNLRRFLRAAFPRTHRQLKKEIVGGHSLLYEWRGTDAALKPILLMAHMDVVPVDPAAESSWTHGPFSGEIAGGFIWGRGAMDDKASLLALLEAAEHLLATGFQPRRTIFFAFGHDEEVGGHDGAAAIAETLRSRSIELEFVLDEGLNILKGMVAGTAAPVALIGIAEKGYLSLKLSVQTAGGHSSMPPAENAIGVLSRAVQRLAAAPFEARLGGAARQMLDFLGPEMPWTDRVALANLWLFEPLVIRRLAASPFTNAFIRTTIAPTLFNAGIQDNVLPATASVVINLRLLPGDTMAAAIEEVRKKIDDPRIKIAPLPVQVEASPLSDAGSPSFQRLHRTIRQIAPEAIVAPALLVAATDSRHYAPLTKNIFRFLPVTLTKEDTRRYHGIDERISIADYERLIRFYAGLIRNSQS
jgi:carboxypeptidase PM20D1